MSVISGTVGILWALVRFPLLALLTTLEPFVSFILSAAGTLGIAAALLLEFSGDLPQFPFWGMIGFSVGALLMISAYRALLGILAR